MSVKNVPIVDVANLAQLMERLGHVPLERIRMTPLPGSATEKDLLKLVNKADENKFLELVDGVLVEKAMGATEALLGGWILHRLWEYLEEHDLGQALPGDGMLRLMPGSVRIPDVSFISWAQMPDEKFPTKAIPSLYPDLAVEVLSKSNTAGEMDRKRRDYFLAGTKLVWIIDPESGTAEVYSSPTDRTRIPKSGSLDGGEVLPGFRLSLKELFSRTSRRKKRA